MRIIDIPIRFEEIEDGGFHLFVEAQVNGKEAVLLLDTGASKTVFDAERIQALLELEKDDEAFQLSPHKSTGLGTNDMDSYLVQLERFSIGAINLHKMEVVVLPMGHVNEAYRLMEMPEIDGVLGSDILAQFKATIYFKRKLLKLYQSEKRR